MKSDRDVIMGAIINAIEDLVDPLPRWEQLAIVLRVLPICGEEKMEQILNILGYKLEEDK